MESNDRILRKNAFNSLYNNYKNSEQSTTEIYLSEVKLENEFAKLLNYESLLDRSTRGDESSIKVYDTLISSVNKNMKIYHKYHDLRRKILGLGKDYTLFALPDGFVKFETFGKGKKRVSIYSERKEA